LINAQGEAIQAVALAPDPSSPGQFQGAITPPGGHFRLMVEGRDETGNVLQRVDPRLFEAKSAQEPSAVWRHLLSSMVGFEILDGWVPDSPVTFFQQLEVRHVRSFQMGDD
jgi:hypothetical protein